MPRRFSVLRCSTSPTSPTIVRLTPRLTNASPPAFVTRSTTPSTSLSPASAAITTTITVTLSHINERAPGHWPGALARSLSAHGLAGDRPGTGPVAKPKPELLTHGSNPTRSVAGAHRNGQKPPPFPLPLPFPFPKPSVVTMTTEP